MRIGALSHIVSPTLLWQLPLRSGLWPSAKIGCPVLITAGSVDRHTTFAETQRLFNKAHKLKTLHIFEGAAHVDLLKYDPEQYAEQVLPFLANSLAKNLDNAENSRDRSK
jgi:alpha-beta hydrolase superfamily lysophospholipase